MKTKEQKVIVKKDTENPEPIEVIAKAILDLSKGMEKLNNTPIRRRVILLLLNDATGLPMGTIDKVLTALPYLKRDYLK
jgi:hypothetical protein